MITGLTRTSLSFAALASLSALALLGQACNGDAISVGGSADELVGACAGTACGGDCTPSGSSAPMKCNASQACVPAGESLACETDAGEVRTDGSTPCTTAGCDAGVPVVPPPYCPDGIVETEPAYVQSTDGKECSVPKRHCLTKAANACPLLSPRPPGWCSDGTIVSGKSYMASSDGKECVLPNAHCLTNDLNACPFLSPRPPGWCSDGTIESGKSYIASSDGKECELPNAHCLTKNALACPMP